MNIKTMAWGNPNECDFDLILDYYSGTKINSIKTSTVPLAQYWQDTEHAFEKIRSIVPFRIENASLYFEYPTKSFKKNKSSMSDVMILEQSYKIAIEAKYTEYSRTDYESISHWYRKSETENRRAVLNHWINIIAPYSEGKFDQESALPYQFLHRTASACYGNPKNAVVIFQLFWDTETQHRLDSFIEELKNYMQLVQPRTNLRYVVHTIETHLGDNFAAENVFQEMKTNKVSKLGREEISFA